jgi:hypothetical protein
MKFVMTTAVLALVLLAAPVTPAGLALVAPAQAESGNPKGEALWRACRKAVFRKYGYRRADRNGRRYMSARDAIRFTDVCVANGGRVP